MLAQITSLFLHEFAVGTLVFMLVLPLKDLKNTFFALNGGLSLFFLILSYWLCDIPTPQIFRWLFLASIVFLIVSYLAFLFQGHSISRGLLCLCAISAAAVLAFRGVQGMNQVLHVIAPILGALSLILGALLLGVTYGTMILGHWYLVTPQLPFRYLINASRGVIAVTVLRSGVLVLTVIAFLTLAGPEARRIAGDLMSFEELGLFSIMRVFWGILGPLVLSWMILETAKLRSNQSATGILYVACIFVFIGELFAVYLFQIGGFPA